MKSCSETGSSVDRNNNFNLLRFVFATLVILAHSPDLVDGDRHRELLTRIFHTLDFGALAVDGFFLLSGYLILQSWEFTTGAWAFLAKRCLRIYPGFIIASLLCALIVGPLGAQGFSSPSYFAQFKVWPFLKSVFMLDTPVTPRVFEGQPHPLVNGALWTITYEFRCYLLVLLFGVCGLLRRRRIWLGMFLASLVLFVFFPNLVNKRSFFGLYVFFKIPEHFFRFFVFFAAGGCFYLYRERIKLNLPAALVGLPILLACLFNHTTAQLGLATLGGYILFTLAFTRLPVLEKFRRLPDISYGVYLYGWPAQKLFLWYFPALSPWTLFLLAFGTSCFMGFLSWCWVEAPFLRLKPLSGQPNVKQ